jgi:4-amino-4-deoxy-L-arabinose transferase-like glycosyltransferase
MPPDEPRFALMARDMVTSGDWLFPMRGDELYSHKPPTFMWLQALAYAATGNLRIAFLLPSLLAGLLTLGLVWDLARRLWSRRAAGWAFLALLTTLQFALQAKRAQIDAVVVAMMTASMYGFVRHHLLGDKPRWAVLGWFMAGLGTITKGVGFLPLLMLPLVAYARHGNWRELAPKSTGSRHLFWLGPLAFVAATAIWLGPMLIAVLTSDDPALHGYANDLLFRQTATRYADPWHHHQPPWYFLPVIATLWLPFALALPWLIPSWWRRLKLRDARILALVGWALLVLVFFSLSPGKREVYILPALPALCVAAAPFLPWLLRRRGLRIALFAFIALLTAAALYAGFSALLGEPGWLKKALTSRGLHGISVNLPASLAALGIIGAALLVWQRLRGIALTALVFVSGLWFVYGLTAMPALSDGSSSRALMRAVGKRIGPDAELGLVAWREQNLLQADRPVTTFGFERALSEQWHDAVTWLRAAPAQRWLFLQDTALPACVHADTVVDAGFANRRHYLLIPSTALPTDCDPAAEDPEGDGERHAE